MTDEKIEVGDRVKCVRVVLFAEDTAGHIARSRRALGRTGRVVAIDDTFRPLGVRFDGHEERWWVGLQRMDVQLVRKGKRE
jgi:hypothetical protein